MRTLGTSLKEARKSNGFTLRQVEETSGISNAYLSQLENDKIKSPSANILYKLSSLYQISLKSLLGSAGIIQKEDNSQENKLTEFIQRIAFSAEEMTAQEREKVLSYLEFIKSQKGK